jgi:hypothetical protein
MSLCLIAENKYIKSLEHLLQRQFMKSGWCLELATSFIVLHLLNAITEQPCHAVGGYLQDNLTTACFQFIKLLM